MSITLTSWLVHFFSYNVSWISCVYFASIGQAYTGPLITIVLFIIQLLWQRYHQNIWKGPLVFAIYIAFLGALVDSFWLYQELIVFKSNPFGLLFSPPWMICLWLIFSFNLFVTLEPFLLYYKTLGLLIFVSLPFGYWIGVQIGAATLISSAWFYFYLGAVWAILLPINLYFYHRWFKRSHT